jgi:catechol 2,3-dioxygenase-like lactoylglutathione lyase family enzyme
MNGRKSPIAMPSLLLTAFLLACGNLPAQTTDENPLQLTPHHATASVADLEKESAWYEHVLGFREAERFKMGTDFEIRHMTIPGFRIDLACRKGSVRRRIVPGDLEQGWFHIVFKTPSIDTAYKFLVAKETDVKADRNDQSAITRLIVHDPEGNEIELIP